MAAIRRYRTIAHEVEAQFALRVLDRRVSITNQADATAMARRHVPAVPGPGSINFSHCLTILMLSRISCTRTQLPREVVTSRV